MDTVLSFLNLLKIGGEIAEGDFYFYFIFFNLEVRLFVFMSLIYLFLYIIAKTIKVIY